LPKPTNLKIIHHAVELAKINALHGDVNGLPFGAQRIFSRTFDMSVSPRGSIRAIDDDFGIWDASFSCLLLISIQQIQ
jgi:hypothetical protein